MEWFWDEYEYEGERRGKYKYLLWKGKGNEDELDGEFRGSCKEEDSKLSEVWFGFGLVYEIGWDGKRVRVRGLGFWG